MGTLRDMARTGLIAICFGSVGMGAGHLMQRAKFKEETQTAVGWMATKRANALEEGRSVKSYDETLSDLRNAPDYNGYQAAGYFAAAGLAVVAAELVRRYKVEKK